MINLSIINELCEKKGITKKKMCDDLGFAPSKVTDMLKNNSTTLVNIEKIANYFGVSVGVFFGEQPYSLGVLEKYKKSYQLTYENLCNIANTLRKLFFPCITDLIFQTELFYSGFFHKTEEGEKPILGIIGKPVKYKRKLDPKSEEDRVFFAERWIDNDFADKYQIYNCLGELLPTDFINMQRAGILDKKEGYIMSLWAKAKSFEEFLALYVQFRDLKDVEDLLEQNGVSKSRFGEDYNEYEWEDNGDNVYLKYDKTNGYPIKKKTLTK